MNDDNPAGEVRPRSTRKLLTTRQMRGAAPKSCVCATSRLAPTHVPALSALPGVLERSKVAFGSRHPGNPGQLVLVPVTQLSIYAATEGFPDEAVVRSLCRELDISVDRINCGGKFQLDRRIPSYNQASRRWYWLVLRGCGFGCGVCAGARAGKSALIPRRSWRFASRYAPWRRGSWPTPRLSLPFSGWQGDKSRPTPKTCPIPKLR